MHLSLQSSEDKKFTKFAEKKSRLWVEILNTSYPEDFKIKKTTPLGFLVM